MTSLPKKKIKIKTVTTREKNLLYKGKKMWMVTNPFYHYWKTRNDIIIYTGNWKIENNKLYLISLCADLNRFPIVGVGYLFPGQEIVFAEWYTGVLLIPLGRMLIFIYSIEVSVYERDLLLKFENGLLVEEYERDNSDKYKQAIERQKEQKLKRKEEKQLRKAQVKNNKKSFWEKLFGKR